MITFLVIILKTPLKMTALERTFSPHTGTRVMSPGPGTGGISLFLFSFSLSFSLFLFSLSVFTITTLLLKKLLAMLSYIVGLFGKLCT